MSEPAGSEISIAVKERVVSEFLEWLRCWDVKLAVADYDGCPFAIMDILGDHPQLARYYANYGVPGGVNESRNAE